MKIVFRADASLQAGHGHVMRCLTLAGDLHAKGADCAFVCRAHKGHLAELIGQRGFKVHLLPLNKSATMGTSSYAEWIGDSWQNDAAQTVSVLENRYFDWLVVDHYGLDGRWESKLATLAAHVLVIDDLANRPHDCDLLIDQTFGRKPGDYRTLLTQRCSLLYGSDYALLRKDYKNLRTPSLARRMSNRFENILIFMGGSDPQNFSLKILQSIEKVSPGNGKKIHLVLGAGSVWKESIEKFLETSTLDVRLRCNVDNLAKLISEADCAIGAPGGSTWERACLGLPMIQLQIADNQAEISRQLADNGSVITIDSVELLASALELAYEARRKLSLLSASLVDGKGTERVVDAMLGRTSSPARTLRPASLDDSAYLYALQLQANIRKYFRNPKIPDREEHERWFCKTFAAKNSVIFVIEEQKKAAGIIRLDLAENSAEVSVIVSPEKSGQGLGRFALKKIIEIYAGEILFASVHKENRPSQKLFKSCSFTVMDRHGDFLELVR